MIYILSLFINIFLKIIYRNLIYYVFQYSIIKQLTKIAF